jgi:hypothetical protein
VGAAPAAHADAPQAAPAAKPAPTITMKVGVRTAELERLRAKSRVRGAVPETPVKPAAPQSLVRPPRSSPAAAPLTLPQAEGASRRVAVNNRQATPKKPVRKLVDPVGDAPPGALVKECFDAGGADKGIGRVHNRFTYCQRVSIAVEYWSIDNKGVPIEKEGTTSATLEVFAQGDNKERRIRSFARIQKDSVDYDWGPIDNIFVAPNVPLGIIAQCAQGFQVCHAYPGAATMPWVVWDNNSDWYHWDVYNHESFSEGRDKLSYNQWFMEFFTDNGEYHTIIPGRTPRRMLRCDSATYFNQGAASYPKACVFSEVTSRLTYKLVSDHRSVAFHVYNAQYHPNNTCCSCRPAFLRRAASASRGPGTRRTSTHRACTASPRSCTPARPRRTGTTRTGPATRRVTWLTTTTTPACRCGRTPLRSSATSTRSPRRSRAPGTRTGTSPSRRCRSATTASPVAC